MHGMPFHSGIATLVWRTYRLCQTSTNVLLVQLLDLGAAPAQLRLLLPASNRCGMKSHGNTETIALHLHTCYQHSPEMAESMTQFNQTEEQCMHKTSVQKRVIRQWLRVATAYVQLCVEGQVDAKYA